MSHLTLKVRIASIGEEARSVRTLTSTQQFHAGYEYVRLIRAKANKNEPRIEKYTHRRDSHLENVRSLSLYRINSLRPAARILHLAYGFIRGRSYETMERMTRLKPNLEEVGNIAKTFSQDIPGFDERHFNQDFERWVQEALAHLDRGSLELYPETKLGWQPNRRKHFKVAR